jgi:hypothetical protein
VQKHKNIYDRFGYLDVVVHDDLTVERKKLKRGAGQKKKRRNPIASPSGWTMNCIKHCKNTV